MRLAITSENGDYHSLDIDQSLTLQDLKSIAEVELKIPAANQVIIHNGKPLKEDKATLSDCGIVQDDILLIIKKETRNDLP